MWTNTSIATKIVMAILVFEVSVYQPIFAQPVKYSKSMIHEVEVYSDLNDKERFYYAPGEIYLEVNQAGKPTFTLLQMRYTGTAATGNQGEIRYTNIVQFKVKMHEFEKVVVDQITTELGSGAKLYPIPMRNIEAYLVAPFEGKYKRIGKSGSFEQEKSTGDLTSYWTERTFTVRLENHEAQLLWDMVENGNIALSVAYTYYADMIGQIQVDASVSGGSRSGVEGLAGDLDEITAVDSVTTIQILRADAFNIDIDLEKYPDVLVQTDLNESVPPSYPALEVICFDFTDDLRPDLEMKTIEFEATGVSDQLIKLRSEKFYQANTDLHTRQIRFPYAVNMRKPLRYRVKEFGKDGDIRDSGWITRESWVGGLDITTRADDILVERRPVEFETDLSQFAQLGITELIVHVYYHYQKKPREERIVFNTSSIPVALSSILCDKSATVTYNPEWKYASGDVMMGQHGTLTIDNYAYILPRNGE